MYKSIYIYTFNIIITNLYFFTFPLFYVNICGHSKNESFFSDDIIIVIRIVLIRILVLRILVIKIAVI